jgi:tetratricopeptide (TPR) repeat protein
VDTLKGALAAATADLTDPGGVKRNATLRAIADAGALDAAAPTSALLSVASATSATDSRREVDRGMGLFREKRYPEAAQAFEMALKYNPNNVLAANNLGFTYVKMERLPEAIAWYEKTLVLDPLRALAYANLGDAYAKVGRVDDAKHAYARFLELRPDHKIAPTVRERLAKLPPQHP